MPAPQFRNTWYTFAPPYLQDGPGELYMYTLEQARDLLEEKANQAVKIRFPGLGDPSQFPYLSHDRAMLQGPSESNASFATRLTAYRQSARYWGSARAVLEQLQAYSANMQPGVSPGKPLVSLVTGSYPTVATWQTLFVGDPQGQVPALQIVQPSNFDWDGKPNRWRSWIVMYMHRVATGQSGTSAAYTGFFPGTALGQNINGVWVPSSGTPVNNPFYTISGLSGIVSSNVQQWITISGSSHSGNNGVFQISAITSSSSIVIANPGGTSDAGPLSWSISAYPWISPGPCWGSPGFVFGQGQSVPPPIDTGANTRGIWGPTPAAPSSGYGQSLSWGNSASSLAWASIRKLVASRKSASTYVPYIVVTFDDGTGAAGTEYWPASTIGNGNPDGTFGSHGRNVAGVFVPTRKLTSQFDCYVQGTGVHNNCSVENQT